MNQRITWGDWDKYNNAEFDLVSQELFESPWKTNVLLAQLTPYMAAADADKTRYGFARNEGPWEHLQGPGRHRSHPEDRQLPQELNTRPDERHGGRDMTETGTWKSYEDEETAVAWFTSLSPNEQLRKVREMSWNLAVVTKRADESGAVLRRQREEISRLSAECASHRPDGYETPRSAESLIKVARENGWDVRKSWSNVTAPREGRRTLAVSARRSGHAFRILWSVPEDGNGAGHRSSGLARRPGKDWYDAPSLREITRILCFPPE